MQMFDAESVHRLLPYEELIAALQKMHEGEIPVGDGVYTDDPEGTGNMFVTLPGWLGGRLSGRQGFNVALASPRVCPQERCHPDDTRTDGRLLSGRRP